MKMPAFLRAMRPQQWAKNVFVLAAFGFAIGDQSQQLPSGALASAIMAAEMSCGSLSVLPDRMGL